jgi:KUP system potassium uptake protein
VFLTSTPETAPHALLHSLKHYHVLHEQNVFLTVQFLQVPWSSATEHVACEPLGHGAWKVILRCGFVEAPDVAHALELCGPCGLEIEPMQVSYFLSREKIIPVAGNAGMALWRERMFAVMARNAGNVTDFFNIPTNRVVELGTRVEI